MSHTCGLLGEEGLRILPFKMCLLRVSRNNKFPKFPARRRLPAG